MSWSAFQKVRLSMGQCVTEIVKLYESNCRDIVSTLRGIADSIEGGDYGDVLEAALILNGTSIEVFGLGDCDVGATNLLLDAAKLKFSLAVLRM